MRDPDVVRWATAELQAFRRDLAISLRLAPPFTPMGVVIRTQLAVVDTELARRLADPSLAQRIRGRAVETGGPVARSCRYFTTQVARYLGRRG
jgi:hypothetical protein